MRALVTGCAGFIGSHLTEMLLATGWEVLGADCFTETYGRPQKEANLAAAKEHPRFRFVDDDLLGADLQPLLNGVTHLFHLAGEPGVRSCWGDRFPVYIDRNLLTTQTLLEAVAGLPGFQRFILASTSTVYGLAETLPTPESVMPRPISPYGVTKHAAEEMVWLYGNQFGVPGTVLRYFTVYGPRQRPDMAFHQFFRALLADREITLFGTGGQTRDFTHVSDIVDGTIRAALRPVAGQTINLGRGEPARLLDVVATIGGIAGREPRLHFQDPRPGEMAHTAADITVARRLLDYAPQVGLEAGLRSQFGWMMQQTAV